jgi:hypothetical protein
VVVPERPVSAERGLYTFFSSGFDETLMMDIDIFTPLRKRIHREIIPHKRI